MPAWRRRLAALPASPRRGSWRLLCAAENVSGFLCGNVSTHRALTLPGPPVSLMGPVSFLTSGSGIGNVFCLFVCLLFSYILTKPGDSKREKESGVLLFIKSAPIVCILD